MNVYTSCDFAPISKVIPHMKIGFIGQGWIGRHYADDFESRGYETVRFGLEEEYAHNKHLLAACDIVFIAVPTPTTTAGFDDSIVREVIKLVGAGKIAVLKSTVIPGTTKSLQEENREIFVLHSPEFLSEATAAHDAAHPHRNIVGIPEDTSAYREKAQVVLDVLPPAPYARIMDAKDAEFVKYAGNCFLFTKIIFINMLYDLVASTDSNWQDIRDALIHDPRIGASHTEPVHTSGRGAGGHCFIKDFEAFRKLYESNVQDIIGTKVLDAQKDMNLKLLVESGKDLDIVRSVYGIEALH